jgi:hypothetical protein
METALILRGRLSDPRHIELDEAVAGIEGEVEVVLRAVVVPSPPDVVDVFDLISAVAPGTRTKDDIDRQLAEDRGAWGDR